MKQAASVIFYFVLTNLFFVHAQTVKLTGTVLNAQDQTPIAGASVISKQTQTGVVTDFNGNFSMQAELGTILVFSYLGFESQEVAIKNENSLRILLQESLNNLEEVSLGTVAASTGYGTQEFKKVSGAISAVGEKTIGKLSPLRAEEALQGNASGVNVVAAGSPGAKPTILIRGISSNKGNAPLVVIDGMPQTLDDLNALNPSDIAQIDILKDASTAAIYGASGGNGVILISTKQGSRNQKMRLSYNGSYGIQQVRKFIRVLNASEYAVILNEASVNSGGAIVFENPSKFGYGTNWQKKLFRQAPTTNHNLSVRGGGDTTTYFLSIGHTNVQGVMGTAGKSKFKRLNLTGNFTTNLTDSFQITSNTNYANINDSGLNELFNALNFDPTVPVYDKKGAYSISKQITQEVVNPLASMENNYNDNWTNKLFGKLAFKYEPLHDLTITSRLGYVFANVVSKNFTPLQFYGVGHNRTNANPDLSPIVTTDNDGKKNSTYSSVSESMTNWYRLNYELFANYKFNLQKKHFFNGVLGGAIAKTWAESISANARDIPNNSWEFADVSAAKGDAKSQTSSSWQSVKRNLSFFGRINYDYRGKYLASFTVRRDGSTSFGKQNKFGIFPSGSLGWVISNESFFKIPQVNFLKFRASYGALGNDNITPQFPTISNFPKYTFSGTIKPGAKLNNIANDALSWEHQIQINAGFDLKMFQNTLSLSADVFQKQVSDLLFNPVLSPYLGTPGYPSANVGNTRTRGLDITLTYNNSLSKNIDLTSSVNFTTVQNKVLKINSGDKFIWMGGYGIPHKNLSRFEEGKEPGYFYGHKTNGIFQSQKEIDAHAKQEGAQPGDIRFVDINGDGKIDEKDRTHIGSPYADYLIGWNFDLRVYDFDFSLQTYTSVGADIYRAYERNLNYTNRFGASLNRWTGPGTSHKEPRVTFVDSNNNNRPSDRYVEDGSFFKIKNVQLGYRLHKNITQKIGIATLRIYGQIKNALVLTKYSGYDPEVSAGVFDTGVDRGTYPIPRTFSIGIDIKF